MLRRYQYKINNTKYLNGYACSNLKDFKSMMYVNLENTCCIQKLKKFETGS